MAVLMFRLLMRLAFGFTLLLALVVAVIQAAPYDESAAYALLTTPENCSGVCLLGIRPGRTTVNEARTLLERHPWVASVQLSASGAGYGQMRWVWSGQQPAVIDDSYHGRITFYWDDEEPNAPELGDVKIETISINTRIRMDTLQTWLGAPDSGTATFRLDGDVGYSAAYYEVGGTVSLSAVMRCPVNLLSYWEARAKITATIGRSRSVYVQPAEMATLC